MSNKITKSLFLIGAAAFLSVGSSGAYFSDTAVISGNVFSTGTWSQHLVINEVYYDTGTRTFNDKNTSKVEGEGKNEWIEIYNPTDTAVSLKNWTLTENSGVEYKITENVSIPAKGFALISHDNDTWKFWGEFEGENIVTINLGGKVDNGWLNNDGDVVILRDGQGTVIDQMCYGTNKTIYNPASPDAPQGQSLERNPKGFDSDKGLDFVIRPMPTPGAGA
jgi:predicted ribosomally synthesized peptide with SipW-like signal peptide